MFNNIPPITLRLVIANVLVFVLFNLGLLNGIMDSETFFAQYFSLYKTNLIFHQTETPYFLPIQLLTSFFAHAGFLHLLLNMFALVSLGGWVERVMGPKRYLAFYLFSGVVGGILVALFDPSGARVLGASGAICGILAAFALFFPQQKLTFLLYFIPITVEARKLAIGMAVFSLAMIIWAIVSPSAEAQQRVSHFGHLSGMVAAMICFYSGFLKRF